MPRQARRIVERQEWPEGDAEGPGTLRARQRAERRIARGVSEASRAPSPLVDGLRRATRGR